jgi:acyl-coenzyme A synthetase/AMP-(fatty) acid ligase
LNRILEAVEEHARHRPDAVAIRMLPLGGGVRDTTWKELIRSVERNTPSRTGGGLVTIPLRRSPEAVSAMLGAMAADRPFAFLDPRLKPAQTERIRAVADESDPGSETGAVLFTSGSTGEPKGVRVGRSDLDARALAEVEAFSLGSGDRILSLLVFAFDVGLNQLLSSLLAGSTLVVQPYWLPGDVLDAVEKERITGISAVPAVWRACLVADAAFGAERHGSLRYLTISGGDLPEPLLARMPGLAGPAGIIKTYGQTETFRSAMLLPAEFTERPTSVGRVFPGARFRVDPETARIHHSGLGTMLGYLGSEGPPPESVDTGDLGRVDEGGYLFVTGRDDDMVKRAGNRVYPGEVARALIAFPSVADAEVVAVRDDDGEGHLAAFVIVSGGDAPSRRELTKELPGYLVPSVVCEVRSFPLTPNGKPDRRRMKEMAAEALGLSKSKGRNAR